MKQKTKVIHRPPAIDPVTWALIITDFFLGARAGEFILQGAGVFSCAFADLTNSTIVVTTLQSEGANQESINILNELIPGIEEIIQKKATQQ